MSKLRSVNTQFWSDPWVEDMTPSEKLLYLYFITNEKTNMLGVYELSVKKICFETGINKETVLKALKAFEKVNKVRYTKNYIILLNFAKHQNYNTNMKKSAIDVYNNLPNELKVNDETIDKSNPLEGFERVLNRLGMVRKVEIEVEDEKELETKKEIKKPHPSILEFKNYAIRKSKEKNIKLDMTKLELKFESWKESNWIDGHGNKIVNWKSKILNTLPYLKLEKKEAKTFQKNRPTFNKNR